MDWNFLEGTMERFRFQKKWIKGVSALYSGATSRVLLVGDKGTFQITRSIRQGCPLTPFLFLSFAKVLNVHIYTLARIQGIMLPFSEQKVLDAEFADDTRLFLKGTLENL